jgi:patatin-like phospholipase/acyl hydrolase
MSEEDVQWFKWEGQNYRTKSENKANSIETVVVSNVINNTRLYHSGIPTYIIAFQLDMNEEDVYKIIQSISYNTEPLLAPSFFVSLLENKLDKDGLKSYLDDTVNTNIAIKNAQVRMCKALRSELISPVCWI